MKALRIFPVLAILMAVCSFSFGQSAKTETFKVSGNCGMCKSKIEKAAKEAGATTASWNVDTKELTVKYNSTSTNTAKIQQKIAAVGYDNAGVKATAEAYDKLHGCCKYDRSEAAKKDKSSCCSDEAECAEHKGDHDAKADCCKDGKCTKEGHSGADCCKKSD
jgi:copper chaperone CopZ